MGICSPLITIIYDNFTIILFSTKIIFSEASIYYSIFVVSFCVIRLIM